jgi:metal-responsive CopG/Arc/MetJ family transcriptional regulator
MDRIENLHTFTYPVFMKNVTIALDESLLREVRRVAADRSTTLNAMIRAFLEDLAHRESHAVTARRRIVELCRQTKAEIGPRTWSRDDLHER